jgi:hypothetical protein
MHELRALSPKARVKAERGKRSDRSKQHARQSSHTIRTLSENHFFVG